MLEEAIGTKEWVNASRRFSKTQSAGMHIYISSGVLSQSLWAADIPQNAELKVKRYALNSKKKGLARILLEIKER